MAVVDLSDDEDHLQRAIEYAFYVANHPAQTNYSVDATESDSATVATAK